jgi:hypothetical protein
MAVPEWVRAKSGPGVGESKAFFFVKKKKKLFAMWARGG